MALLSARPRPSSDRRQLRRHRREEADITLKFEDKVPVRLIPKDGASFDFQGEPASYTPNPFMMVMEKGQLLKAKAAPTTTKKPPVHHKPAAQ